MSICDFPPVFLDNIYCSVKYREARLLRNATDFCLSNLLQMVTLVSAPPLSIWHNAKVIMGTIFYLLWNSVTHPFESLQKRGAARDPLEIDFWFLKTVRSRWEPDLRMRCVATTTGSDVWGHEAVSLSSLHRDHLTTGIIFVSQNKLVPFFVVTCHLTQEKFLWVKPVGICSSHCCERKVTDGGYGRESGN